MGQRGLSELDLIKMGLAELVEFRFINASLTKTGCKITKGSIGAVEVKGANNVIELLIKLGERYYELNYSGD